MAALPPDLVEKVTFFSDTLRGLASTRGLKGLKLVGGTEGGGAKVNSWTGDVRVDLTTLRSLSLQSLAVIAAHEAGHVRSFRRRQARQSFALYQYLWCYAGTLGLLLAVLGTSWLMPVRAVLTTAIEAAALISLGGALLELRRSWNESKRQSSTHAQLEEEVRADAFACHHAGGFSGVTSWLASLAEYEALMERPRRILQFELREQAILELYRTGQLAQRASLSCSAGDLLVRSLVSRCCRCVYCVFFVGEA